MFINYISYKKLKKGNADLAVFRYMKINTEYIHYLITYGSCVYWIKNPPSQFVFATSMDATLRNESILASYREQH